ncbi:MAG: IS30 family transposase [Candidatus Pacebacteria bacterium]|nr:IS30 family transposase [Candidatus Paceibacterota bacterium]
MYKHIKRDDRVCIALMLRQKHTYTDIAKELGFHRTAISREVKRNSDKDGVYKVCFANKQARVKRKLSKIGKRIIDNDLILKKKVCDYLKKDWSPQQFTGVFEIVSHMTIYRYIDRSPEMKQYLRRQGKQRRKYGTKANLSRYQANKRSIHDRPKYDNTKGHWEGDTIVGKERKLRIVTYVDRMSGFLVADLTTAKADDIHIHAKQSFKRKPCKTITYDNGSEFALHKMIEKDTKALVCFADGGKPQQRGANENANGLLRQYFPKGSSFATITNKDVQRAVRKLNSRPRKRLNYLTPQQVFRGVQFKC